MKKFLSNIKKQEKPTLLHVDFVYSLNKAGSHQHYFKSPAYEDFLRYQKLFPALSHQKNLLIFY